ncbi:MAG: peptidoglycan-binding protein [Rhodoblastus sp.]|nr:MAG: peptidoglycan-binding protein [Rhodoblastus sp.]
MRVEGDGAAVVAGRGEPGAAITLMVDGRSAGEAVADAAGQFVIVPTPLPPGERALSLASRARDGAATTSAQAVTILGAQEGRDRVVALAEPGAPTRILSDAAPKPADSVGIRTVEAEQGGAFYASGVAPAGANVRLYLNAGAVAEARASAQGAWSIRIEKGMKPGAYQVRADHLDAAGKVVSRAEVTFEYPAQTADVTPGALAPNVADQSAPRPAPSSAQATPSHEARRHDGLAGARPAGRARRSLWRMSARLYGSGHRYTEIYAANARQIRNPDLIYPGQIFVAPDKP